MIEEIKGLPGNAIGFTFKGKVTGEDYESVIFPVVKKVAKAKKKFRIICRFSKIFKKFNLKALMDDATIGMKYYHEWERIAIVSDHSWLNHTIKAVIFFVPGRVKLFASDKSKQAIEWISE